MLETWTLTSRVIYEYERAISFPYPRKGLSNDFVRPQGFEPGFVSVAADVLD